MQFMQIDFLLQEEEEIPSVPKHAIPMDDAHTFIVT
jgi:hypothetical protein